MQARELDLFLAYAEAEHHALRPGRRGCILPNTPVADNQRCEQPAVQTLKFMPPPPPPPAARPNMPESWDCSFAKGLVDPGDVLISASAAPRVSWPAAAWIVPRHGEW